MRELAVMALALAFGSINFLGVIGLRNQELPVGWQNFYRMGKVLTDPQFEGAVIACRKPLLLHVVSGRRCAHYRWGAPDEVIRGLEEDGVTHVLAANIGYSADHNYLVPTIRAHPTRFHPIVPQFLHPGGEAVLFRFTKGDGG
uniref:Uncharacterized protein n=1 Tax=viral metagenome TaxID=1070528 RepID=A0A6M3K3Y3_9ZZZZ